MDWRHCSGTLYSQTGKLNLYIPVHSKQPLDGVLRFTNTSRNNHFKNLCDSTDMIHNYCRFWLQYSGYIFGDAQDIGMWRPTELRCTLHEEEGGMVVGGGIQKGKKVIGSRCRLQIFWLHICTIRYASSDGTVEFWLNGTSTGCLDCKELRALSSTQ